MPGSFVMATPSIRKTETGCLPINSVQKLEFLTLPGGKTIAISCMRPCGQECGRQTSHRSSLLARFRYKWRNTCSISYFRQLSCSDLFAAALETLNLPGKKWSEAVQQNKCVGQLCKPTVQAWLWRKNVLKLNLFSTLSLNSKLCLSQVVSLAILLWLLTWAPCLGWAPQACVPLAASHPWPELPQVWTWAIMEGVSWSPIAAGALPYLNSSRPLSVGPRPP